MAPPREYRRNYLQWFKCPSCGQSRLGPMSKMELSADYTALKILFRCDRCTSVCYLKRPAFNTSLLLIVGGPFIFAPTFYALSAALPASLGLVHMLLPGLGGAAAAYLAVVLIGRATQTYVPLTDRAA